MSTLAAQMYYYLFLQSSEDYEKENGFVIIPPSEGNKDAKDLAELIKVKGIVMKPIGDGVT